MSGNDAMPLGEGWARHNNEMLVHGPSQVFFAQQGNYRGQYLLKSQDGGWSVCPAPHSRLDCPIEVRAAAASLPKQVCIDIQTSGRNQIWTLEPESLEGAFW